MEVKVFNLKGQSLPYSEADYERAYYSSVLRMLYPMNYPGILLYPLFNRVEIIKPIIQNLVHFSFRK